MVLDLIPLDGRSRGNCRMHPEVLALQQRGYNAHQTLCQRRCPHVDSCDYLEQFAQEGDFFATQPMLLATNWWQDAGILVLDEFDPGRLARTVTLSLSDLAAMRRGTDCPHAHAVLRWLGAVVGQTVDCQRSGGLLLDALAAVAAVEGSVLAPTLYAARDALPTEEEQSLLPGFPQGATLADYEALPPAYLPILIRQLVQEHHRQLAGETFTSRLEVQGGQLYVYLRHGRLIAQLASEDRRTIILDATVNAPLLAAIFPDTPLQLDQPHLPIPARVTQVISRDWAKSGLRGAHHEGRRDRWADDVASHVRPERHTLVVCTLEREAELAAALAARGLTNVTVAHYGALRGSNAYNTKRTCITDMVQLSFLHRICLHKG